MARINLDDRLKSDVRFDRLAADEDLVAALQTQTSWRRRLVLGALTDLWFYCYHQGDVVTEDILALCMQVPGKLAADTLIEAGLAVVVTRARSRTKACRLLRIKGVRQRAKYMREQSEKGRNGGIKSGESRRSKRPTKKLAFASPKPEANGKPPDLDLAPDHPPDLAHAQVPDLAPDQAASRFASPPSAPAAAPPVPASRVDASGRGRQQSSHQRVVEHFTRAYEARNGSAPTWGGSQGQVVKSLLERHPLEVVLARISAAFTRPPAWMAEPIDIFSFGHHFDKFPVGGHHTAIGYGEAGADRDLPATGFAAIAMED